MLLIEQIPIGYRLLPDLIDAGHQLLQEAAAICVGSNGGQRGGIHTLDGEGDAFNGLASDGIGLQDLQIGHPIIGYHQLADLAGEQLHMIFMMLLHIAFRRIHFNNGIDAGLQIGDVDLTIHICDAIQIVCSILDLRNTEGCTGQTLAIVAIQLHELECRHLGVGEHKLGIFIAIDLDDASGVVDQVAVWGFQLRYLICSGLQCGQVNLAVFIGHVLLGEGAADMLNPEPGVGLGLQGGAVQLDEVDTGLLIVHEDQLQDAVGTGQFNLLGIGVDDVLGISSDLFNEISAGFQVS